MAGDRSTTEASVVTRSKSWWYVAGLCGCFLVGFLLGFFVSEWSAPTVATGGDEEVAGDRFGLVKVIVSILAFVVLAGALWYQRRDLIQTTRQHAEVLRTQVLLQLMDEIRSQKWGNAHARLTQWRAEHQGEFVARFIQDRRADPTKSRIDQSRRAFVRPIYKVWHLHTAKVVSDELAAQIITPRIVSTTLEIVEPFTRAIDREIDPLGRAAEAEEALFRFVRTIQLIHLQQALNTSATQ